MSKYENYYPTTTCFKDKETNLKKKESMCEYCYSCYLEICETISNEFDIPIKNNGILKHNCLDYLCEKIYDKIGVIEYSTKSFNDLKYIVNYIIIILNKYTNYNKEEKKEYNLLHISFIECLMKGLDPLIRRCYTQEIFIIEYNYTDEKLKTLLLYKLNILCLEVYFNYIHKSQGYIHTSMMCLYKLIFGYKKSIREI
jgi:hypothetical protein